jgi:hypothetical protein
MDAKTEIIKTRLADGKEVRVEALVIGGERDIAAKGLPSFEGVTDTIESVSNTILATLAKIRPEKATVEFGLELAVESGVLTALIAKGTGTASLKVSLEWSDGKTSQPSST